MVDHYIDGAVIEEIMELVREHAKDPLEGTSILAACFIRIFLTCARPGITLEMAAEEHKRAILSFQVERPHALS